MELFKASQQWSTRPADERFESIQALYDATKHYHDSAREKAIPFASIRVEANEGEITLVGKMGIPAQLTHWSFGQLAQRVEAPASYLRALPATLAAQNLNHGLAKRVKEYGDEDNAKLLFHKNDSFVLRAITSERYERIWNYEIAERLLNLETMGWTGAKPTLRWDGGNVNECMVCNGLGKHSHITDVPTLKQLENGYGPSGIVDECQQCKGTGRALPALYASDHDMFAFVTNQDSTIKEPGSDAPLYRGVIVSNSEVGAATLSMTRFLYRAICGNHIIWGATKVIELNLRHIGDIRNKFGVFAAKVREYAEESSSDEEYKIKTLQHTIIGKTKLEVLDKLFGVRSLGISRKALEASYESVDKQHDGNPNSVWGFVQGVTRYSQSLPFADERTKLDKAAGKIMEIDF